MDRAVAQLEKAVQLHSTQAEARYQLGRAYLRAGRNTDAQREFALARELRGQDQQAIQQLTQCEAYLKQNRTEEALALARELAQSQDPEVLLSLGMLLGRNRLHREALPPLERAARLRPSFFEAYLNMGLSLVASREYDRAGRDVERGGSAEPGVL